MRFIVTDHALDRFVERVRPSLGREQASDELWRLLERARVVGHPPGWYVPGGDADADRYVLLTPEIVLPGVQLPSGRIRLMSCICRGGIGAEARERRNARRARRRRRSGARVKRQMDAAAAARRPLRASR
jgi:hypothetical protein